MDELTFAKKMIELAEAMKLVAALEDELAPVVLKKGKTQVIGGVRATYRNARKTWDWEGAADDYIAASDVQVPLDDFKIVKYDWKKLCETYGVPVEGVVPDGGQPFVTFKLEE